MPHHVAILAYDGLCTFEFGCAVELFALARPELGVAWYTHAVCAVEAGPLRATGGLSVAAPHGLEAVDAADTVVIPGWRGTSTGSAEAPPPALLEALRRAHARGARLCAICSGSFVLAHAGLLDGRRATTHWRYLERLAAQFPAVRVEQGVLYTQDGSIVTSAGSAAGLDMLLHVVRSDFGTDVASRVAQRLVIPAHRDGDQAQLVARPLPDGERHAIARLMDWVRENPRVGHTVDSMAARARMGTRTFQRRFKDATGIPPMAWLVRERIALAQRILETQPDLAIDIIADLAGLGSAESLRHHFRGHGLPPPGRYRRLGRDRRAATQSTANPAV